MDEDTRLGVRQHGRRRDAHRRSGVVLLGADLAALGMLESVLYDIGILIMIITVVGMVMHSVVV